MSPIDRLLCDLDAHPWSTSGEAAERLGWSQRLTAERLSVLRAVEIVERCGHPERRYALAGTPGAPEVAPPRTERVLRELAAHPWSTVRDLCERLGLRRPWVQTLISEAREDGRIVQRLAPRTGRRGRPAHQYALAGGDA